MDVERVRTRPDARRNRAALLDAAAEVLAAEPQASLAEVASRAGLGRATLYRHFDSRESLMAAIREEALARATAALAELDLDCGVGEGVRRAAAALVPLGMRFRILLVEGADTEVEFLARREVALAPLWRLVDRGIETGELDRGSGRAWSRLVLASLLVSAVRATAAGAVEPGDAGDLVARTYVRGLGPAGGNP